MTTIPDRNGYALVTGAGARLGAALARRLAADGWAVAIHYRHSAKGAETLAQEIKVAGGRAVTVGGDLAALDDFTDMFGKVNAGWGFCSLLVNSASAFE